MSDRETIYRLMYEALLEIREAGKESGDGKVFHLADLLHNVPLQMERAAEGERTYEEIMEWIRRRAGEQGIEKWLEKAVADMELKAAV